ncbi:MAG: hypothetical protein DWQ37_01875 [Planctomycetota bacterium]|nr:MAG: hypothetical protein DWQ37_01875 [Planctomycetota bacterium]
MTSMKHSPANQVKLSRVEAALQAIVDEVLERGFYGAAKLEVVVADGTIQRISRVVERVEK